MSFPFELVTNADAPPFGCLCRIGVGPFVKTGHLVDGGAGQVFLCTTCVAKIAALHEFVLLWEFEGMREQFQIASSRVQELMGELDRAQTRLDSGEVERLRDELEQTRQERDSFSARANTAERENLQLRSGDAASVLREAITETVAAFAAPATTTKGKAA
jgi:hypothetical protein